MYSTLSPTIKSIHWRIAFQQQFQLFVDRLFPLTFSVTYVMDYLLLSCKLTKAPFSSYVFVSSYSPLKTLLWKGVSPPQSCMLMPALGSIHCWSVSTAKDVQWTIRERLVDWKHFYCWSVTTKTDVQRRIFVLCSKENICVVCNKGFSIGIIITRFPPKPHVISTTFPHYFTTTFTPNFHHNSTLLQPENYLVSMLSPPYFHVISP